MLTGFFGWWLAQINEMFPTCWLDILTGRANRIIAEFDQTHGVSMSLQRRRGHDVLTMDAAVRLASRRPVLLRVPAKSVLRTDHVMPAAVRPDLDRALRYELGRITPFDANDLFWRWDYGPMGHDKARVKLRLTLVPKIAVAEALHALVNVGIRPRFIQVGWPDQPCLLPVGGERDCPGRHQIRRGLTWGCAALAVIGLVLPGVVQAIALRTTDAAIASLQPTMRQVDVLRHHLKLEQSAQEVLAGETARRGELIRVLATLTQSLPDDTYLFELSLHDRQVVLHGWSSGAARLITTLSADPAIQDAAFIGPVTRAEAAPNDLFSIRCRLAPP